MTFGPAFWFYSGTLLSSIGSFAFNICLIAFMTKAAYGLFEISLILGLQRLIPLLITGLTGHLTDRIAPRLNVVLSEFIAAITTHDTGAAADGCRGMQQDEVQIHQ